MCYDADEANIEVPEDVITIPGTHFGRALDTIFLTYSTTELLKAHRSHHMYEVYKMQTIPFANEVLHKSFKGQVLCSYVSHPNSSGRLGDMLYITRRNIYSSNTLLVFLHDL